MMQECLLWEYSLKGEGYGQLWTDGKNKAAHIVAWEALYGAVPKGKYLDHICHNDAAKKGECSGNADCLHRRCYNPNHLALVTPSQNTLAGLHSMDVKKTCPKGHSYRNPENIMVRKNGKRECAECNRQRAKLNYARSR